MITRHEEKCLIIGGICGSCRIHANVRLSREEKNHNNDDDDEDDDDKDDDEEENPKGPYNRAELISSCSKKTKANVMERVSQGERGRQKAIFTNAILFTIGNLRSSWAN